MCNILLFMHLAIVLRCEFKNQNMVMYKFEILIVTKNAFNYVYAALNK